MRSLALETLIALSVLLAAPFLGCDGRAHAGIITFEALSAPLSDQSPLGNLFVEEPEPPTQPSVHAADPVCHTAPDKPLPETASLALFGRSIPGAPSVPESESSKSKRSQSICMADRPEVSPPASSSLCRSSVRLHLPDSHLCRLFRPPRQG